MALAAGIIEDMAAKLTAASGGVPVSIDPRNVAPPCYLITARSIRPRTVSTGIRLEIAAQAVAPGIGHGDALQWLDTALETMWEALGRREANLVGFEAPQTGGLLLAYEVTYSIDADTASG